MEETSEETEGELREKSVHKNTEVMVRDKGKAKSTALLQFLLLQLKTKRRLRRERARLVKEQTDIRTQVFNSTLTSQRALFLENYVRIKQQRRARKLVKSRSVWTEHRSESWYQNLIQNEFDDSVWRSHFCMSRQNFMKLCEELTEVDPEIVKSNTHFRDAIPVPKRVAVALWSLIKGDSYRVVGEQFGIAKSSACEITGKICSTLYKLKDRYIRFPSNLGEYHEAMKRFEEQTGFPHAVGAIDASHIPINMPKEDNSDDYINSKSTYSIILQAVVDANCCFTNIHATCPGGLSDVECLKTSPLYNGAENREILIEPVNIIESTSVRPLLLGDSAYPLSSWLMQPFKDTGFLNEKQINFNNKLSRARIVVRNAIGLLKGRWQCLLKRLDNNVAGLPYIITVCCILHNICQINGEEINFNVDDIIAEEIPGNQSNECEADVEDEEATNVRNAIVNHYFV